MEFQVQGKIIEQNDADLLDSMQWMATNYGSKIQNAQAIGETNTLTFTIIETAYNDAVTTLLNLKTQFGSKLVEYRLIMG